MNLDFVCNDLHINQKKCEKEIEFNITQDIIVPDSKPDILEIIHKNINMCIEKCEVVDSRVEIYGLANAQIMYMGDNETNDLRGLETDIEIRQHIEFEELQQECIVECEGKISRIECKTVNERKVNVSARIKCKISAEEKSEIKYIDNVFKSEEVQTLSNNLVLSKLLGYEKQNINISEEIKVNSAEVLELVEKDIQIVSEDYKISYNKALVKAEMHINLMYTSLTNNILTQEILIPFTGFIELNNITDKDILDVSYNINNLSIKLNDNKEDKKILVNANILANVKQYTNEEIQIVEDLYCINNDVKYNTEQVCNDRVIGIMSDKHEMKQIINLEELDCNVLCVKKKICKEESKILNDKIHLDGEVELELVLCKHGKIFMKTYQVPFNHVFEHSCIKDANSFKLKSLIKGCQYLANENRVEILLDICFKIILINTQSFSIINNIEECETRTVFPFSITIYYVKSGDTLWNIAKNFKTTIDEIAQYNDIENPNEYILQPGMKLFIPRKSLKKLV